MILIYKLASIIAPAIGGGLLANSIVNIKIDTANALSATMTAEVSGTAYLELLDPTGSFTSWKAFIGQYAGTWDRTAAAITTGTAFLTYAAAATVVSGEIYFSLDFQKKVPNTGAVAGAASNFDTCMDVAVAAATYGTIGTVAELAHIDSNP